MFTVHTYPTPPVAHTCRAVGWHLHAGREAAQQEAEQWKGTAEGLEAATAAAKAEWTAKQDSIEAQMKEIQELLCAAEGATAKLTGELSAAEGLLTQRGAELAGVQAQLGTTTTELEGARATLKEREAKIREMEEVVRQSQAYSATLQTYNTSLQDDLKKEKVGRDEAARDRDTLQTRAAELSGQVKSLEHQLAYDKAQVTQLAGERDVLSRDVAALRTDLDTTRQERDRLLGESTRLAAELDRIRSMGGKSLEAVESLTNEKATLEVQLSTQQRLLGDMRKELAEAKEHRALAESATSCHTEQMAALTSQVTCLQAALSETEAKVLAGEGVRRRLHNIIQELKGNIRVFCRVRPLGPGEEGDATQGGGMACEFPPPTDVLGASLHLQAPSRVERGGGPNGGEGAAPPTRHTFTFDKVFAPPTEQGVVFEEISELVQSALDGHKVCIFAYGQTGSGKTYTMLGTGEQPGMIPRAMRQIFDTSCKLGSQGWKFMMQASLLEIYNEDIRDLLARGGSKGAAGAKAGWVAGAGGGAGAAGGDGKKHNIVHNADGTTDVTELTVVDVTSSDKVESLLSQAMERRAVGATQMNEHSSRSHMVFTLRIDGSNANTGQVIGGVLNLVDLAGSERVKESGASGQQLKEAQNINRSLSALGDVIAAIATKERHIPFRNSKLTYLLQNCLGGESKTLMFVNIAPSREYAPESLCSLRFAAKVNACEINPRRQQPPAGASAGPAGGK